MSALSGVLRHSKAHRAAVERARAAIVWRWRVTIPGRVLRNWWRGERHVYQLLTLPAGACIQGRAPTSCGGQELLVDCAGPFVLEYGCTAERIGRAPRS